MNNPFNSPAAETLKQDAKVLANDAAKVAQNHIVQPAVDAAHRVGEYARDAAARAGDYARQTLQGSRQRVSQQFHQAERYAEEGYDRTKTWISANPLAAVGVALVAGLLLSSLFRPRQ